MQNYKSAIIRFIELTTGIAICAFVVAGSLSFLPLVHPPGPSLSDTWMMGIAPVGIGIVLWPLKPRESLVLICGLLPSIITVPIFFGDRGVRWELEHSGFSDVGITVLAGLSIIGSGLLAWSMKFPMALAESSGPKVCNWLRHVFGRRPVSM